MWVQALSVTRLPYILQVVLSPIYPIEVAKAADYSSFPATMPKITGEAEAWAWLWWYLSHDGSDNNAGRDLLCSHLIREQLLSPMVLPHYPHQATGISLLETLPRISLKPVTFGWNVIKTRPKDWANYKFKINTQISPHGVSGWNSCPWSPTL